MESNKILTTLSKICEHITTRGVYSNYAESSEQLSDLLMVSDPAEINDIMLHISRLSFLKTPRSVYQWATPKFAHIVGFDDHSLICGKLDIELAWAENISTLIQAADEQLIRHNSTVQFECKTIMPDTTERFFKAKLYPVYNPGSQIAGILGIVRDVLSSDMQAKAKLGNTIMHAN